jgi:hypothetical protein
MTRPSLVWLSGHMCDARLWHDVRPLADWVSVDAPIIASKTVHALAAAALKAAEGLNDGKVRA